jgi:septum formation protein
MAASISGKSPRFKVLPSLLISMLELENLVEISRSTKFLACASPRRLKIILGSSSPARREILADMGYEFTVMVG